MAVQIEFEHVSTSYRSKAGRVEVFEDFSMVVNRGDYAVLLGKSGSGKTTLLNLIAGFMSPDTGRVLVNGMDLNGQSGKSRALYWNRTIGFVFQSFNLIDVFTALENVMVPLVIAGEHKNEARFHARQLLDEMDILERRDHRPSDMSGGEQQRVAIARALACGPEIVIADEPTSHLDAATTEAMLAVFDRLHEEGTTLVIATHDESISARATRVIRMQS